MVIPRVFTIAPSAPFLPTLIRALCNGELIPGFPAGSDPLALAAATLYLPTRRACRLARDAFLDILERDAAILPRILPLGDVDDDEIAFAQAASEDASDGTAALGLDLQPGLGELERRLLLAQLVLKWASGIAPAADSEASLVATNPISALALAEDLARLIDDMTTRGVEWKRLDALVPEHLDRYWQLTLQFLKIAREAWPQILAQHGAMEATARRDALLKAEASRLRAQSDAPVIVAGSTGSMPSTAELMTTIARLPHGAVVLPGLDLDLDEESWNLLAGDSERGGPAVSPLVGHPQFAMQALLRRMGIGRAGVARLGSGGRHPREVYVSEALRPAAATERWQQLTQADFPLHAAIESMSLIEAANAEEEALAIAVALREAVAQCKTAALITPDRALARRVLAALGRWDLHADDSGGEALIQTGAGRFASLAAQTALGGLAPVPLLALLKHPLARLGASENSFARGVEALEMATLRGPRPRPGSAGLMQALATLRAEREKFWRKEASALHPSDPRTALTGAELDCAAELIGQLSAALKPLETLAAQALPLRALAARHQEVVAALSASEHGEPTAFRGHDGVKLLEAFDEIASISPDADLGLPAAIYPEIFATAIGDRVVRPPQLPGVRVHIYGPLEARLQSADRVVLAGLVEGVWPPTPRSDPWLSRPMRHALGLDLPERRISLSAHDFAQALGAPEVVLAYPARLGGAPTVPSRFVQRLAAVAGGAAWDQVRARGTRYLAWARALDRPAAAKRIARPAPKPPRAARPASLSVTDVENWLRDPYSIYAKHILRVRPLELVDAPPGAADRGVIIHAALNEFTRTFAGGLPADPAGALIEIGARHFAALEDYPEARAFWWPRFLRIAGWFAAWEAQRRGNIRAIKAEVDGKVEIPLGERVFTLRARADRIEQLAGGAYAILDYKTGQVPTDKQVQIGVSPQLTLEAAILQKGGFPDCAAGASLAEIVYVSLKGGEPGGEARSINFKNGDAHFHANLALAKLTIVAQRFESEEQPYLPLALSMWKSRYGSYDHLARVMEWSVGSEDEAEASAPE